MSRETERRLCSEAPTIRMVPGWVMDVRPGTGPYRLFQFKGARADLRIIGEHRYRVTSFHGRLVSVLLGPGHAQVHGFALEVDVFPDGEGDGLPVKGERVVFAL